MTFARIAGALFAGALALLLFLFAYEQFSRPSPLPSPRDTYRSVDARPLDLEEPVQVVRSELTPTPSLTIRDARGVIVTLAATGDPLPKAQVSVTREFTERTESTLADTTIGLAPGSREEEACFGLLIRLQERVEATASYPALDQLVRTLESTYWRHLLRELYRDSDGRASVSELQLNEPVEVTQIASAGSTYALNLVDSANITLQACLVFDERPPRIVLGSLVPDADEGWTVGISSGEAGALYGVLIRWHQRTASAAGTDLLQQLDRAFAEFHGFSH